MNFFSKIFNLFNFNKSYKEIIKANTKTEDTGVQVPVIDVTEPAQRAEQELLQNWEKFANYDAILQIDEKYRYELLKDIYDNWDIHGVPKSILTKYSEYNEELLEQICMREKCRLNIRIKAYRFRNLSWLTIFVGLKSGISGSGLNYNWCMCTFDDFLELNLTNKLECFLDNGRYWGMDIISNSQGVIMEDFKLNDNSNINDIRLYHNGELHIFSKEEFLQYKEKHNLNNLYLTKEEKDEAWRREILESEKIQFDPAKRITKKYFEELIIQNRNKKH